MKMKLETCCINLKTFNLFVETTFYSGVYLNGKFKND